jgi:hypothetical protein
MPAPVGVVGVIGGGLRNKQLPLRLVRELALVVDPADPNPVVQWREHLIVSKVPLHSVLLLKAAVLHQPTPQVAALLLSLGEDELGCPVDVAGGLATEQGGILWREAVLARLRWWWWH